jgi:hypothetical protein
MHGIEHDPGPVWCKSLMQPLDTAIHGATRFPGTASAAFTP